MSKTTSDATPIKSDPLTPVFESERCPYNAAQLRDIKRTEAERRRDVEAFKQKRRSADSGSRMVKNHKPFPELKPSPALSNPVKAQSHRAAMKRDGKLAMRKSHQAKPPLKQPMRNAAKEAFMAERRKPTQPKQSITHRR